MDVSPPKGVGLGGDGDELVAIDDVESAFGVKLDYADAPHWLTAGDLYTSLLKVLPAEESERPDLWKRFAVALCGETGVNPDEIEPGSPLLSESRVWTRWIIAAAGFLVVLAAAFLA